MCSLLDGTSLRLPDLSILKIFLKKKCNLGHVIERRSEHSYPNPTGTTKSPRPQVRSVQKLQTNIIRGRTIYILSYRSLHLILCRPPSLSLSLSLSLRPSLISLFLFPFYWRILSEVLNSPPFFTSKSSIQFS